MVANTKDSISRERRTVKADIRGKMEVSMLEVGRITRSMDRVLMCGQTADSTKDNG